jgi:hypothetical protein
MKLEYNNALACEGSMPVGSFVSTLCILEPMNIDIILEDDDLGLLGLEIQVRFTGTVHIDRYETVVRHGTLEFTARPIHTEEILDISKSLILHARRNPITIDLTSLGVDVSQLPSSLEIMGHSARDEDSLISTESPMLKMSVKYMLGVANRLHHDRKREVRKEIQVLGRSLTQREARLETAMLWPEAGYSDIVSLQQYPKIFPLLKQPRANQLIGKSLLMTVQNYEPFTVRQQSESATTRVMLGLKFNGSNQEGESPPCLDMSADWALQPAAELLNASCPQREYSSIRLNDLGVLNGKNQSIVCSTWQREKSEFDGATWTAEQELCITTPTRRFLTPTFFTDKLQHTYNLRLKISCRLPRRVFGHTTRCSEFNLPVTVIYEAPSYASDQSPPEYST